MFKKLRLHLPWLLVLGLFVAVITRYLWSTRSVIETHDGIFHVIRLIELTEMVKLGQFPVRWAGTLDNGFGLPLFNYVYPGPYYLGLPLTLLGIPAKWVIKLLFITFYLLGAIGYYALFAKNRRRALLLSLLYLSTPYVLLNLFVRGALGEFIAISLFPWVILSLHDLRTRPRLLWYHPLPYALLFLTHNFLSFLFLPLFLIYAFFLKRGKLAGVSLCLSLGLSAFFVLPMLLERDLLLSVAKSDFTYTYLDHFLYPSQLLYSAWGTGYSIVGAGDKLSFQLGIPHLLFLFAALWLAVRKRGGRDLYLWLGLVLAVLFMLLPLSQPVWALLTPLQIIQFPWRLLALTSALLPLLAGTVLTRLNSRRFLYLVWGLLALALILAWRYSTPNYLQNPDQFQQQLYIHRDKTTTSSRRELLPKWSTGEERWKTGQEARLLEGGGELEVVSSNPVKDVINLATDNSATRVLLRRHYFPTWRLTDEKGRGYPLSPDASGEIVFTPELGTHTYTLSLTSTPVEYLANTLTLVSFLAIIALAYVQYRSR